MLGYIKHNGESIATNGSIFHVGTVKDPETGYFIQSKARSFPTLDEAKAFIDAGKPEIHKGWTVALDPRPQSSLWIALRFGVGMRSESRDTLIRMIDFKNAELTHSTHQRENA